MIWLPETEFIDCGKDSCVLINLVNGNAEVLSASMASCLQKSDYGAFGQIELQRLKERGYLFSSQMEYESYIDRLNASLLEQSRDQVPNFMFVPTYQCNLNCYYCFEGAYSKSAVSNICNRESVISCFECVDEILDNFRRDTNRAFDSSEILFTLTGGEPLLRNNKDAVECFLSECNRRGFTVSIVSNCYEAVDFFDLLEKYHVNECQLTLDGSKKVHDTIRVTVDGGPSYDRIASSIAPLSKLVDKLFVRINATKRNIDSLPELADLISGNPDVIFYVYLMQQEGCGGTSGVIEELEGLEILLNMKNLEEGLNSLLIEYHGRHLVESIFGAQRFHPRISVCSAMNNQFIFDFAGSIYKCWWGMGNSSYSVGTYGGHGLKINENEQAKYHSRNVLELSKCRRCKYRYICGGGCTGKMARSALESGLVVCPNFSGVLAKAVEWNYKKLFEGVM